jgi:CheY-like chemotaxis protein
MTNCRILVVDDSEADGFLLSQLLSLMGHTVEQSHDGRDALRKIEHFAPQLILCDILMPKMNGLAFARLLRKRVRSDIRLIAISGCSDPNIIQRAQACGFSDFLIKPIEITSLQDAIASCIAVSQAAGSVDRA